ncbi:hypothetical protein [Halopenitus persicus]|uniref:hypothetical protein n=1 Tax=Halopenitus persicus TaxID=1048396 RepID=UPI0012FD8BCA|nr:hypothetical protein [Halopenitus persicus]
MPRASQVNINKQSRRRFLKTVGATLSVATSTALAGCQGRPFGPGANSAYYHAYGPSLDVDYDTVMDAARDAGYTVDEPYYVGTKEPESGIHPAGLPDLDDRFGPDYRVMGATFFYTQPIFLELWFAAGDEPVTASVFDDSSMSGDFDVTSLPPADWLVPRLTLAFEMDDARAREYVEMLKDAINDGTDIPSVEVTEEPAFSRTYESLTDEATESSGSETYGDGWYKMTFVREGIRLATIDLVVQSMKINHRRGEHTYTTKLDRLGGFNLRIELPPQEDIPEDEYQGVFRQMFSDIGLPPEIINDLTFEYTPTVW